MKKILAALALLALVFGGAAAQDLEITGEVKVGADLFNVKSIKFSNAEAVKGDADAVEPEADWRLIDGDSFNWEDTIIKFKVTGDNYGATFAFGAPPFPRAENIGNTFSTVFRQVELWLQPASFLKIWAANGDTSWKAVERYKGDIDDFDIAYGTNGFDLGNGNIDEFKNGMKADIILGEAATVELLAGVNQPLWLATGKMGEGALLPAGVKYTVTLSAAADTTVNDFATIGAFSDINVTNAGINSNEWAYVRWEGGSATAADALVFVSTGAISKGKLATEGNKKLDPYGRIAPNYGLRVTLPVADIGKFNLNYRLGVQGGVYVKDTNKPKDDWKVEGYDVLTNQFGIFADVSPLFASMDLPLGLVAGYTGYFKSGEKVEETEEVAGSGYYVGNGKFTDATPYFVSGIDLRATYALVPDTFTLAFHNNVTMTTLKYEELKKSKYAIDLMPESISKSMQEGGTYFYMNKKDYTYLRWVSALGLVYQVIPETFSANLQLANDLQAFGYYAKGDEGKGKGDAAYANTFKVLLTGTLNVSETASLTGGFGLDATDKTNESKKPSDLGKGKAAKTTDTKFYIPLTVSVKF
ncbi:MAG: hypothetical protein Pg6C_01600 [Treponemataceae bacterium]|nr:MAG: hypothetical protein Pg6C_01600 [Treponemataceae bacterium]